MADWKTYAKAARSTARKQAPGARDAALRGATRAGDYARAAGRALDAGHRPDDEPRERAEAPRSSSAARRPADSNGLARDAAAYYTVAGRRARALGERTRTANLGARLLRALRDALLIGLSLVVIWAVLFAAGLPIPFSAMILAVGVIVALSFGAGLVARHRSPRGEADGSP